MFSRGRCCLRNAMQRCGRPHQGLISLKPARVQAQEIFVTANHIRTVKDSGKSLHTLPPHFIRTQDVRPGESRRSPVWQSVRTNSATRGAHFILPAQNKCPGGPLEKPARARSRARCGEKALQARPQLPVITWRPVWQSDCQADRCSRTNGSRF